MGGGGVPSLQWLLISTNGEQQLAVSESLSESQRIIFVILAFSFFSKFSGYTDVLFALFSFQ